MPVYDRMTPFEEPQSSSPGVRRHKLGPGQYSGRAAVRQGSQCLNASTAGFSHPRPPTLRPLTPTSLEPEVLGLSYYSTHSSACENRRGSPQSYGCGSLAEPSGLDAQTSDCCVCADIACESEGRDTPRPSSADTVKPRSHVSPKHHHRRHSLFYEPILLKSDYALGQIDPLFDHRGTESALIGLESNLLEDECNALEVNSNPLEHEAIPLEEIHSYEDPYYAGAEERLSSHKVSLKDWDDFCRVQKARSEAWIGNKRASSTSAPQIQNNTLGPTSYAEGQRAKDDAEMTSEVSKDNSLLEKHPWFQNQ